jgi:iron complex transport system ATP-binding protein
MPRKAPLASQVLLDIRNATLARGTVRALKDFSWSLRRGEHWAVLGPNGSGKSSLVQMLQGWLWPQDGTLSVLGRDFGEHDVSELRRHVAWVGNELENEVLPHQTVRELVTSGAVGTLGIQFETPGKKEKAEAAKAMGLLGLAELAQRPFNRLSQGQRRRAVIARALAMKPDLLLLDEATGGLDPVTRERFLKSLDKLLRPGARGPGPALVYITHHSEEILPSFTHVLLLRGGRVVAAGPKAKILTPALLEKTFGAKLKISRHDGRVWLRMGA